MDSKLLRNSCERERKDGRLLITEFVCRECFDRATDVCVFDRVRGKPEVRIRSEPFDVRLENTPLPKDAGQVVDIAPVLGEDRSLWLLLAADGLISRFDADAAECTRLVHVSLTSEPDHKPWCDHNLKRRLHASLGGDFAAVVNDYGRYGQIIDLRSGRVTLALDGGDYHGETVPFSFAFAQVKGRVVAIHRTAWNRLDMSDPSSGDLLTARGRIAYRQGEKRPDHYLDYFHGALCVSPTGASILDDGWEWHPVGTPTAWSLERWLSDNVWESEDGPSWRPLCARAYYWDQGMTWLDDHRVAIGGIGDDDDDMIEGVRIFDISVSGSGSPSVYFSRAWPQARELTSFAGPAGSFFGEGQRFFSSDESGLSRWDVSSGCRTGYVEGFKPKYYHRGTCELVQLFQDRLVRCKIGDARPAH